MKFKLLLLFIVIAVCNEAFADSIVERRVQPRQSAIQSSNMVFSDSALRQNDNIYNKAVNELQKKISDDPNNYILYVSLIDLYIKTKQNDKAFEELVFLNNLAKKNKLDSAVLKSVSELVHSLENGSRYYKNNDILINIAMMNLILQEYSKAENCLINAPNSKLFTPAYKELFDTSANYRAAIALADKILLRNPSDVKLRKLKTNYLLQLNNKEEARKELTALVSIVPQDLDVKYDLYNLLVEQNKQEKDILKVIYPGKNTDYEKAYSELAEVLLKHNDIQSAKMFADKLIEKYPDNVNGYIMLSEIYRREGNLKDSYDVLRVVRDKADDNESVSKYNVLLAKLSDEPVKEADSLMNNGLYSQALTVLESANPENLYVILGMARANYFLNKKQKTFELLNKAMTLYPENSDVFYYFAYIFYKENDIESSRNYLSKALKITPGHKYSLQLEDALNKADSDKLVNQIISSFESQNYTEAMRLIDEALKINKKDSLLYYYKGLTYIAQNNYSASTAPLYKAVDLDKNNIPAYFYLGLAFDNLSEYENALSYYKKFINLLPKDDYGESEKLKYAQSRIEKLSK